MALGGGPPPAFPRNPRVQPHRRQPTRLPRPWDSPGKNTGVGCHFLLQCMKAGGQGVWTGRVTGHQTARQVLPSPGRGRACPWTVLVAQTVSPWPHSREECCPRSPLQRLPPTFPLLTYPLLVLTLSSAVMVTALLSIPPGLLNSGSGPHIQLQVFL